MSNITSTEEQRLKTIIRKGLLVLSKNNHRQNLEEQRLRMILRHLIKEVKLKLLNEKEETAVHASTGINELEGVLKAIKQTSKDGYKQLATEPDQRRAFIAAWKWLFKASFSNDIKLRNAAEDAAKKIDKEGFDTAATPGAAAEETVETEEELMQEIYNILSEQEDADDDDEPITMKITDPDLQTTEPEPVPPTEEEEHEFKVSQLVTAPDDLDKIGPAAAVKVFNATKKQVLSIFNQLSGTDAENFYKWFFINMLGTQLSGFADESIKPVTGHFQYAESELQTLGIETSPELLPVEDPEAFNIKDTDF